MDTEDRTPTEPPAVVALPDKTPLVTAQRAFASRMRRDPIVRAFLHCERLQRIRKLSREQWEQELRAFTEQKR